MREGDYLVTIREQDVKWSSHASVVQNIRDSGNKLRIQIVSPLDKSLMKINERKVRDQWQDLKLVNILLINNLRVPKIRCPPTYRHQAPRQAPPLGCPQQQVSPHLSLILSLRRLRTAAAARNPGLACSDRNNVTLSTVIQHYVTFYCNNKTGTLC